MVTIDEDGNDLVKLIGLGLAKPLADTLAITQPGTFVGKCIATWM